MTLTSLLTPAHLNSIWKENSATLLFHLLTLKLEHEM